MNEADVVKKGRLFAKSKGVPHIRLAFQGGVTVGWPDDLYLIPGGRPLMIEYKATGKKPTARQEHKIKQLKELGYDVEVCDSPDAAREAITRSLEAAQLSGKSS